MLTVDPRKATYPQRDESLSEEVSEEVEVIRTDSFEPLQLYAKLAGRERVPYGGFSNEKSNSALSRFLRGNFFIPDARKGWNRFAHSEARKIISERDIDCVITTGPPHSTHLIGLQLKRETDIPWGVDLRDPWTEIYYNREMMRTPWAKRQDLRYEKAVLGAADFCITASHGFAELFSRSVDREYHVVTNGYDEAFEVSTPSPKSDRLIISYTGTMAESYQPEVFLKVLSELDQDFEFRIAGSVSEGIKGEIEERGISDSVTFLGYLPHAEVLKEMRSADILLLITPKVENSKGIIPGKLFEYLGTGKPILAITEDEDGDVASILKKTGGGQSFKRSEDKGISKFLEHPLDFGARRLNEVKTYHRKELTKKVSEILNRYSGH